CLPPSGSTFGKGTWTVVCLATEASGHTNSCTFTVTIVDADPPAIQCPANLTTSAALGQTNATVNYPVPTATDSCPGVSLSCVPASGSLFALGMTPVRCVAADAAGNSNVCAFTVTVEAAVCPTITLLPAALPGAFTGLAYEQAISASGSTGPYTYQVTTLPPGLARAVVNGALVISGTPTQNGDFAFTVTAKDSGGNCTGSRTYTLGVTETFAGADLVLDKSAPTFGRV